MMIFNLPLSNELYEQMGLWSPKEGWETSVNHPTAGSYRAIGLDLQGASPEQAARLKQQLEATKVKLESEDEVQLATLTKHSLVGDLLYGTVFNYFALNDLQDQIAAKSANILSYRLPSYGTFSTNLQTQYWYGLPRSVSFGGLSMDIDHMKAQRNSKTNNKEDAIVFSQSIGARMSAMEHLVPEQMFSTEEHQAQGISAVKALALASQQGQKIWTINQSNVNLALGRINLGADAENDIRNAVNAGKIATAHEARINFNGWVGEGYTLIDPQTGAGGYIISGGGNGSVTTGRGMLEVISEVLGFIGTLTDILLEGIKDAKGAFMDAFRFLMGAASKLFSGISSAIETGLGVYDFLDNCPVEVFLVMIPVLLFLVGMSGALIALTLTGFGAIFAGILAATLIGAFIEGVTESCRMGGGNEVL